MSRPCTECEDSIAILICLNCEDEFCLPCFESIHSKGKRRFHETKLLEVLQIDSSSSEETDASHFSQNYSNTAPGQQQHEGRMRAASEMSVDEEALQRLGSRTPTSGPHSQLQQHHQQQQQSRKFTDASRNEVASFRSMLEQGASGGPPVVPGMMMSAISEDQQQQLGKRLSVSGHNQPKPVRLRMRKSSIADSSERDSRGWRSTFDLARNISESSTDTSKLLSLISAEEAESLGDFNSDAEDDSSSSAFEELDPPTSFVERLEEINEANGWMGLFVDKQWQLFHFHLQPGMLTWRSTMLENMHSLSSCRLSSEPVSIADGEFESFYGEENPKFTGKAVLVSVVRNSKFVMQFVMPQNEVADFLDSFVNHVECFLDVLLLDDDDEMEEKLLYFHGGEEQYTCQVHDTLDAGYMEINGVCLETDERPGEQYPCLLKITRSSSSSSGGEQQEGTTGGGLLLGSDSPFAVLNWMDALRDCDQEPNVRVDRSNSMLQIQSLINNWQSRDSSVIEDSALPRKDEDQRSLEEVEETKEEEEEEEEEEDERDSSTSSSVSVVPSAAARGDGTIAAPKSSPPKQRLIQQQQQTRMGRSDSVAMSNAKGLFDLEEDTGAALAAAPATAQEVLINGLTLGETVEEDVARSRYMHYLKLHFQEEALLFYERAKDYEFSSTPEMRRSLAEEIWRDFFVADADHWVNIEPAVLTPIKSALESRTGYTYDLFAKAKEAALRLLMSTWYPFFLFMEQQKGKGAAPSAKMLLSGLSAGLRNVEEVQKMVLFATNTQYETNLLFWLLCDRFKRAEPSNRRAIAFQVLEKFCKGTNLPHFAVSNSAKALLVKEVTSIGASDIPNFNIFDESMGVVFDVLDAEMYPNYLSHTQKKKKRFTMFQRKRPARTKDRKAKAKAAGSMLQRDLSDPDELRKLLLFALVRHEENNVLFYTMLQEYINSAGNVREQRTIGSRIIRDFIVIGAPHAVDVSTRDREELFYRWSSLNSPSQMAQHLPVEMFDAIRSQVEERMMQSLYPAWKRSKMQGVHSNKGRAGKKKKTLKKQ